MRNLRAGRTATPDAGHSALGALAFALALAQALFGCTAQRAQPGPVPLPDGGVATPLYGYSTEVVVRPTHYPGGELRVDFGRRGDLRFFVGRLTGGRVCVSGSCRDVPPFQGARFDLVLRL